MTEEIYRLLIQESFLATGFSSPNPPVASVIVSNSTGEILQSAHTQVTGQNHSEREAYRLLDSGLSQQNQNYTESYPSHRIYVSLEPCTHFGRTPPCRDLILNKKPSHIYVGCEDPHPLVSQNHDPGIYEANKISFSWDPTIRRFTQSFLDGFFHRVKKNRPKLIFKTAVTKDGFFTKHGKQRTPISSKESNCILQMLRAKVDAILVGPGTIESDIPSLEFRYWEDFSLLDESQSFSQSLNSAGNFDFGESNSLSYKNTFWDALWFYSHSQKHIYHHIEKWEEYQPIRTFLLGSEEYHRTENFQKFKKLQRDLQNKFKQTKMIIFTLGKEEDYSGKWKEELESMPRVKVFFAEESLKNDFGKRNLFERILEILSQEGVNHLMVEGGNFLYKNFYPLMEEDDEILIVQSQEKVWSTGNKPYYWDDLKNWKNHWKKEIGNDLWKVFSRRKETCLQD